MRKVIFTSLVLAMGITLGACAERTPASTGKPQATPSPAPTRTPEKSTPTQPGKDQTSQTAVSTSTAEASLPSPSSAKTPIQQPTRPPNTGGVSPFPVDPIREYLASQLSLPVEQVKLIGWQAVTWRDSCLGVHKPREMCLEMITPGFTFKFQTGATTSTVNTNTTGMNFRLEQKPESPSPLPALSWIRSGGFAGVCQSLSVYSTGTYLLSDCKAGVILAQGSLPEGQLTYLNELFERFESFEWKLMPPAGSADMFVDQIRLYGGGSQVITEAEQQKLNEYLATLAGELAK
jgi:hypothetical protein